MLLASVWGLVTQLLGTFVAVDVTVRDEAGAPVSNLVVGVSTIKRGVDFNSDYKSFRKRTDQDGHASFIYHAVSPYFDCSVYSPSENSPDEEYEPQSREFHFKSTPHELWCTFHERRKKVDFVVRKIPVPEKVIVSAGMAGKAFKPEKGTFGFDLMKNDWVPPHGHGRTADFWIDYKRGKCEAGDEISGRLYFKEKDAGFYVVPRASLDDPTACRVDADARYRNESLSYYRNVRPGRSIVTNFASSSECLVLRTRVVHDASGRIASANYSVLRGCVRAWWAFYVDGYMFNTRPNDTNLEFKGPIWR